ncbi:NAD-dependent epimerase/dehydratase family protein [Klebsiella grimontii]|uniref:Nucleoside-diphosphate-sugar epimerase n=2 Tax=Klebsiella oxytoca TaxID=571 RepID=A0A6C0L3B7_KLEOX|nr:NAD-dependent epimerase/dehydratase family protein [Klebsiella grimontii]QHU24217.1 Nucleoside-diphosphate-sugar epimerase [Klebsiella oxytoca]
MKKTVLVAGAVGVIGRSVLAYYEDKDVNLIAISRTKPDFATRATHLPLDLMDPSSSDDYSAVLSSVTHLVFAAYQEKPTPAELVDVNMLMLQNLVEALENHSPGFQHVTLMQGGKAYGCHIGPFPSPAKESDPRHMPPNFYYNREDFLREYSRGKNWSWTAPAPGGCDRYGRGQPHEPADEYCGIWFDCKSPGRTYVLPRISRSI